MYPRCIKRLNTKKLQVECPNNELTILFYLLVYCIYASHDVASMNTEPQFEGRAYTGNGSL